MSVWTKVTAVLTEEPEDWSVYAEVFERHGMPGTVQTDEPPTISAYLAPGTEDGFGPLRTELLERGAVRVDKESVMEEDWAESWKQFFKPRRIGPFLVRPTWEEPDPSLGGREIVLDPGQAFGTGDHPTTRMCLELMGGLEGKDVADIGCGSGILSVAAVLSGARSVDSVDTDPVSVTATQENAARNGVSVRAHVGKGFDPLSASSQYDTVLSNIISAALISLAPEAGRRVRPGGVWIVSGIIEANWEDVQAAAVRSGFSLESEKKEGEWVAAVFRR
ncbi:MAG: 50S ribosomal protein L11 methyltransferase [Armatimonadetes bacterium]|nr:50S ribosomal protein L11 methyltransferase [Armatimonadota bacterium]